MATISVENFLHTDRPLTWRPKPTCDRCLLPFTNEPDDLVRRIPFLLVCQHLMCGQCVQEYASNGAIVCELCKKSTPLGKEQNDGTVALHPSYYMLGIIEQMQEELQNIQQYWEDTENGAPVEVDRYAQSFAAAVASSEINTPRKLRSMLGKACHAYEKSTLTLHDHNKTLGENIDQIVRKVNAHFLSMHNALQLEEHRILRQVRKSFIKHRQHKAELQQRLEASEKRLRELTAQAKGFPDGRPIGSLHPSWEKLVTEVKQFLEKEPLKLMVCMDGIRTPVTFQYTEHEGFLHTLTRSYSLILPDAGKTMQLVPVACHGGLKKHATPHATVVPTVEHSNTTVSSQTRTSSIVPDDCRKHQSQLLEQGMCRNVSQKIGRRKRCNSYLSRRAGREQRQRRLSFSMVKVTCIVNPHEFYVQDQQFIESTAKSVEEQCQAEADGYDSEKRRLTIVRGSMYLARPEGSDSWYRAMLLRPISKPGSEKPVQFMVQYVDYGRMEAIVYDQLRPISKKLSEIRYGAVKCALYNVVPPKETFDGGINEASNADCWPKECVQVMNDFIAGQNMMMCKLSNNRTMPPSSSDCWLVDLFLPPTLPERVAQPTPNAFTSDEWEGYYAPMSLGSMLCYLQQCHLADKHQQRVDANTVEHLNHWVQCATQRTLRLYNIPSSPVLREYDSFEARITHAISPDHFYIMPEQWKVNQFDLLQKQLVAMCREKQSEKFFCPYVGLICAFTIDYDVHEDSRVWLRGRVQKVLIGACEMFALDTGEALVAYWEDMRLLAPGSAPLAKHALAINCRLDHVHPKRPVDNTGIGQPSWSGEALAEFRHISCSSTLRFTVQIGQLCVEFDIYNVLLYLRNKADRETCVNGMLVASGYAVCETGKEDEISDRSRVAFCTNEPTTGGMEAGTTTTQAVVKKVVDPRVPVNVLKVVSPSEIYVQMCSRAAGLEALHESIQKYMNNELEKQSGGLEKESHQWSIGEMCVALVSSVEDDASAGAWYRARILASCEQNTQCEVFLIDRAVTVKVSCTMIARLTAFFAQVQPGAIRCRLACIEPVGGNATWHQSTLDGFRLMIKSFVMHAITLDSKDQRDAQAQSLSVVLWGVRQSVPQPLAPRTTEYRNLNQLLVVRGLAHLSGRFRTFATKGSGAEQELETLEQAIEELQRAEYENMQQFLQHVIAVPEQASMEREGQEGLRTVVNDRETHAVMVDKTCAAALALADLSVEHIDAWPKSQPIEKTMFVGMPTSVGNDGTIFLYDICQEPVLHRIRDTIATYVTRKPAESFAKAPVFKPNDPCLARYHLDGHYYRGTVLNAVGSGNYRVLFVDYGNEEIVSGEHDLLSDVVCVRVPVQISRFRLAGVKPKRRDSTTTNDWPEEVLDACHGLFVQKCCMIRVETSGRDGLENQDDAGIPCRITLLKDSVDVGSVLIDMGLVESAVERKDARRNWKKREEFSYSISKPDTGLQDPLNHTTELSVEHRDLLRFIGQIADDKQNMQLQQKSDFEDPNEIPETTVDECDWMNRQPLDKEAVAFHNDDDDDGRGHEQAHRATNDAKCDINVTNRSLPSPVYFDWDGLRYDTSSRLSDEDDPNDDVVKCCTAGLEGASRGFVVQPTIYSSHGFFAEFTTVYSDGQTLHVFPHLEGHTQRIARMAEKIQQAARLRPDPQRWNPCNLKPGSACLAPYREDGLYYRAIVEEVIEEPCRMRVLYVDYLNRDTLPVSELRRCPSGMRYIPLRNIKVRLVGVRPNPRLRATDVIRRLEEQLKRPFYVKIVRLPEQSVSKPLTSDTVPEVELYTDFDCTTLAYQKMIDEKYYFGGSSS
uniref:RING-type domain-containing protein n=1 Tax=Anopheles farauti TaxID=69004 RepID=A0A182QNH0_9DIPT